MKQTVLSFMLSVLGLTMVTAQDDPVLVTVNGNGIPRSEFEYFLNKNNTDAVLDSKAMSKYMDMFIDFKLKVIAAEEAGLDTTRAFIDEFSEYRGYQVDEFLTDSSYLEFLARQTFEASQAEVGPKGLANVGVITVYPRSMEQKDIDVAYFRLDSIIKCLAQGDNFSKLAMECSQDERASVGGQMGWIPASALPQSIADVVFELNAGEVTEPLFSTYGYQLYTVFGRQFFNDFEEHRASIYSWIKENGTDVLARRHRAEVIADSLGWKGLTGEEALARVDSMLEEINPEFRLISQEYHDGLLLFEISNREVWEKAAADTLAIKEYFKEHQSRYDYANPRFEGLVLFAKSEEAYRDLQEYVKGVPESRLVEKIVEFNMDSVRVRVLRGPFSKGENQYADKIVFGEGDFTPMRLFPYTAYMGEVLSAPRSWEDVQGQVVTDLQDEMEKQWVSDLRKKYRYKVDKKVLKTVNNH